MANMMDPVLAILSILGYWVIILGAFGGPGRAYLGFGSWHGRAESPDPGGCMKPGSGEGPLGSLYPMPTSLGCC